MRFRSGLSLCSWTSTKIGKILEASCWAGQTRRLFLVTRRFHSQLWLGRQRRNLLDHSLVQEQIGYFRDASWPNSRVPETWSLRRVRWTQDLVRARVRIYEELPVLSPSPPILSKHPSFSWSNLSFSLCTFLSNRLILLSLWSPILEADSFQFSPFLITQNT